MTDIVTIPNPVLTQPSKPVVSFDKRLAKIISDMKEALRATTNPKGVGLAAVQIGVPLRLFISRPKERDPIRVFVNPEIVRMDEAGDGESKSKLEGCLSIPNIWGHLKRAQALTLRYQDEAGAVHTEEFRGFPAVIVQHETDHINGILFTTRVLEQKGKFYQTVKDADGKEKLEEIVLK